MSERPVFPDHRAAMSPAGQGTAKGNEPEPFAYLMKVAFTRRDFNMYRLQIIA